MSYCLKTKIQIVILMAKFESPMMVICKLQWQEAAEIPERHTITSIHQRFLEIGSPEDCISSGRPSTITDDIIKEVEEALNREPQTSVRKIDRQMHISKDKARRIMRDIIGFKPYLMHCTQQFYDEDMDLCVEMSECLLLILEDWANKDDVFFSNGSSFYVPGMMNKHNCRSLTANNPFMTVVVATNSAKINGWCSVSSKQIISTYFFEKDTINQRNYLNMLKNHFYLILQKKRLHRKNNFFK